MDKVIDAQTHADVVGLIEAEMGEVACGNYPVSGDRLASLIAARMGYEKPTFCLPDRLPTRPWKRTQTGGQVEICDANGNTIFIYEGMDGYMDTTIKFVIATPKLTELLVEALASLPGDGNPMQQHASGRYLEDIWADAIDILREAGADI